MLKETYVAHGLGLAVDFELVETNCVRLAGSKHGSVDDLTWSCIDGVGRCELVLVRPTFELIFLFALLPLTLMPVFLATGQWIGNCKGCESERSCEDCGFHDDILLVYLSDVGLN